MAFGFACSGLSSSSNEPNVLKSISLENYKTEFAYGEEFSVGDLVVTGTYKDGTTKTVTDYSVDSSTYNKTSTGKYTITIQYTEENAVFEKSYKVTVRQSTEVVGIELRGARTEFAWGEEFVFAGAVQQKFADGRLMNTSDYTVDSSAYNKDEEGKYEITVTCGDFETKYTVKVKTVPSTVIKSFTVTDQTTAFTVGDPFTFDGVVNVEYEDGRVEEDSQNYLIDSSKYQAYKAGTYEVKLTVGEEEYSYNVTVEKANTLKVLMIGNSYADDTRYYVPWIAESLGFEEVVIASLYIGGCSVRTHYLNSQSGAESYDFRCYEGGKWIDQVGNKQQSLEFGIKYKDWDYITIQQASVDSGKASTYNSDLDNLIDYVKKTATNKNVKLAWNMTWAYREGYSVLSQYNNSQISMYNAIRSTVKDRIETNPAFDVVLPAGTAIQNARTSYLGDTFNMDDGTHLNFYRGRYIAGLTLFCSLTGYSPYEVTYAPNSLTAEEILVAKESVKNALNFKYVVVNSQYVD